jgi:hypothetical protein
MISVSSGVSAGQIGVNVAVGRGFTPEELADQAMGKLMHVSLNAPPAIRDQALAFQQNLRVLLVHYLTQAARSERTTLHNKLKAAGFSDAADLVLKI